jgi:hypothetical protein
MAERWLPIAGYEGLYEVSDMGNVRSIPRPSTAGGLLKQTHSHGGYMKVCLSKGNHVRTCAVHRLVASAFVDNPNHKPEVNHLNGDKSDNRAANLDWCTRSENEAHAFAVLGKKPNAPWKGKARRFARRFTDEQVRAIRKDSRPLRVIGMEYGVSKTAIRDIKAGKNYQEVR